jgi:hypothetical protein
MPDIDRMPLFSMVSAMGDSADKLSSENDEYNDLPEMARPAEQAKSAAQR